MNENDLLRAKFRALGFTKIAPFIKSVNSCLSAETWGRMINRNEHIDTITLLKMSAELRFSSAELRSILLLRGEKIIADMISDVYVNLDEGYVLKLYRKLENDPEKTKLVKDLLEIINK